MTRREFNQALAFLQLNPPEEPANTRTAHLMAQIANFAGKSLQKGRTAKAEDYLSKPKQKQTAKDQIAFLKGLKNGS